MSCVQKNWNASRGRRKCGLNMGCCVIITLCGSQASSLSLQRSSPDLPCKDSVIKESPLCSHTCSFLCLQNKGLLSMSLCIWEEGSFSPGCDAQLWQFRQGSLGALPAQGNSALACLLIPWALRTDTHRAPALGNAFTRRDLRSSVVPGSLAVLWSSVVQGCPWVLPGLPRFKQNGSHRYGPKECPKPSATKGSATSKPALQYNRRL